MPKVLSIQQVELHPDADEQAFHRVVFDELAPFYRMLEWEIQLFKGDRGARSGKYLLIFEIPSLAARDRLVPTPGQLSDEGRKIFATAGPVWEKIKTLTTTFLDAEFTDYVMVNE